MEGLSAGLEPRKRAGSQFNEPADERLSTLMQRIPSSSIDLSGFSFAKPADTRKSFSLRGPLNPAFAGEAGAFNTRKENGHGSDTVDTESGYEL